MQPTQRHENQHKMAHVVEYIWYYFICVYMYL